MSSLAPTLISSPSTSASPSGVYFAPETPILFSDSHWPVSTDITFSQIDQLMLDMNGWLTGRMEKTLYDAARYRDRTQRDPPNPYQILDPNTLQGLFWSRSQTLSVSSRIELKAVAKRLTIIRQAISEQRSKNKRGIINFGDLLKWAFGTPNSEDLVEVNRRLSALATNNQAISHSLVDQASIVKELAREVRVSAQIVSNITDLLKK